MDKSRQRIFFGSGAVGLLIGLFIGFLIPRPQSELVWKLLLEYLKVFVSWPVVVLIIALIVIWRFHQPLAEWIKNMALRVPGVIELGQEKQSSPLKDFEPEVLTAGDVPTDDTDLSHESSEETIKKLQATLDREINIGKYWLYNYLSLFFVSNTKRVLAWLNRQTATPVTEYHSNWANTVTSFEERSAILNALVNFYMVNLAEGSISLRVYGKEFIEWASISDLPGPSGPTIPPPSLIVPNLSSYD